MGHLQVALADAKLLMQRGLQLCQEAIAAVYVGRRYGKMGGEHYLTRGDRPEMQALDLADWLKA